MRYRPFRFLTFWLGAPGLIFLLWAWMDSMSHQSSVSWSTLFLKSGGTTFGSRNSINNIGGNVSISWNRPDSGTYKLLSRKFGVMERKLWKSTEWFPLPSYVINRNFRGTRDYDFTVPHWFILLCYTFLWTVVVLLQWLIVKRLKARHLALEVEAGKADILMIDH